jgi:hypothetical protein
MLYLRKYALVPACLLAGLLVLSWCGRPAPARTEKVEPSDPAAVARAREMVQMLDDLYKNYVVHITATYVQGDQKVPAATVTKKVWKAMEDKGWHSGRIVDATGRPSNKANIARTDFEKKAIEKLKGGSTYYEELGTKNGKPVLRAATIVPAVMKECLSCHAGVKEGDLMGALVYEVPVK